MDFAAKIKACITRHGMVKKGQAVCVAFSGGPDSTALLHVLHKLSGPMGFTVKACHYDHAFRGNSHEDAAFAKQTAESLGVEFRSERNPNGKPSSGAQETGRKLRYAFFESLLAEGFADVVATGHTSDDNVETAIMWMLRGAGPSALSGVPPVRGKFIRPLIEIEKKDLLKWLAENNIEYVKDPTNDTDNYLRNRIRRSVIPAIEAASPGATKVLGRSSKLVALYGSFVDSLAEDHLRGAVVSRGVNRVVLAAGKIIAQPHVMRLSIIKKAAALAGAGGKEVSIERVEAVVNLVESGAMGKSVDIPGGYEARLDHAGLSIYKKEQAAEEHEIPFACPLSAQFGGRILAVAPAGEEAANRNVIDVTKVRDGAVFRKRRTGDWLKLSNVAGRKKLKEFLVDRKVPSGQRDLMPLLAVGSEILWIPGIYLSPAIAARESCETSAELNWGN